MLELTVKKDQIEMALLYDHWGGGLASMMLQMVL
jgi:hypothetical protein